MPTLPDDVVPPNAAFPSVPRCSRARALPSTIGARAVRSAAVSTICQQTAHFQAGLPMPSCRAAADVPTPGAIYCTDTYVYLRMRTDPTKFTHAVAWVIYRTQTQQSSAHSGYVCKNCERVVPPKPRSAQIEIESTAAFFDAATTSKLEIVAIVDYE